MEKLFQILRKNQLGFSLVQTLIGGAILGGLGLVAAQLSTQGTSNKLVADANYGVIDLTGRIQTLVSNQAACFSSFSFINLTNNATQPVISKLIDANGNEAFTIGNKYSDGKVRIKGMAFTRTAKNSVLTVVMEKAIAGKNTPPVEIKKDFFINAVWSPANALVSCASDISNFMDTVAAEAMAQACPDPTPSIATGLTRDKTNPLIEKCRAEFQMGVTNSQLECGTGNDKSIVGLVWDSNTRIYKPICRNTFAPNMNAYNMPNCAQNQLLKRNTDGTFSCVLMNCGPNEIPLGLDINGVMQCKGCPSGSVLLSVPVSPSAPLGWTCQSPVCANTKDALQQYFAVFSASGTPICHKLIDDSSSPSCPGGATLAVSGGSLVLSCCSPQCTNGAAYCTGTSYTSSNSCGSCPGTKASDCSNANQYCVGTSNAANNGCGFCPGTKPADCSNNSLVCNGLTYTSNNGCGTCTGSKPATSATWSGYTATATYQAKPGSTCSATCAGGTQAAQRKYSRTCDNAQSCGGSSCSGSADEWRDEGTIACNTQACSCTPRCVVQASDVCRGSSVTLPDNCGGNCPTINGTSPYLASSGRCLSNADDPDIGGTTVGGTSGGGGTTGCFIAGTQVSMANGSYKNIEDVLVGDKVLDGQKKVVTVQRLIPINYQGEIYAINGGGYFFTPNHPFKSLDGWKSLDPETSNKETPGLNVTYMKVGDILVKSSGLEVIYTLDSIPAREKVYNFELDGSHEYIADEYVVHNKHACLSCNMGEYYYKCPENACGICIPNGDPAPHCQ